MGTASLRVSTFWPKSGLIEHTEFYFASFGGTGQPMTAHRIGILHDVHPHGGGSHQWALNILYALDEYARARGDVEVTVVHYGSYPQGHPLSKLFPTFAFEAIHGTRLFLTKVLRRLTVISPRLLPLLRPLFPLNHVTSRLQLDRMLFPVTYLDSLLSDKRNIFCMADIAHVYYPHFPEVREGNGLRMREVLFRHGLANADVVMVETQHLRQEIAKHYGADPAKAHVIFQVLPRLFNLANHPDNAEPLARPYLFYPAQLWAHKNHLNLLAALKLLIQDFPNLNLVLSGSRKAGDQAIFDRVKALGLESRVHYLGYVPDENMPQLYRNAAALVMPTYFGPSNIPTLEAFAFGCPAVISDLPGVEEQVGDAALRFDPDNPQDMTSKISQVLRDPDFAAWLVAAGRKRLTYLSYENFRGQMFSLFDKAFDR